MEFPLGSSALNTMAIWEAFVIPFPPKRPCQRSVTRRSFTLPTFVVPPPATTPVSDFTSAPPERLTLPASSRDTTARALDRQEWRETVHRAFRLHRQSASKVRAEAYTARREPRPFRERTRAAASSSGGLRPRDPQWTAFKTFRNFSMLSVRAGVFFRCAETWSGWRWPRSTHKKQMFPTKRYFQANI